ncbi:hypothetical protein CABS01_16548 [Colletotrichum abscissum]|uniref:uncharacterized protein n=1 Tax=Colletotrichum abscissum TaxID=1671311 RepID=UPI0027D70881|nr:uncharacterized protein CABS01_16548 [Colletotrichum abscissum]KAK1521551.1 hypothetical protein CABS01_16548 [Colletotrichum abscissum]
MDDIEPTSGEMSTSPNYLVFVGQIFGLIFAPISVCLLVYSLCEVIFECCKNLALTMALTVILLIYIFSCFFVFGSWVFQLLLLAKLRMDLMPCEVAGMLCLTAYVVTKLVYLFMVEKAHVIRGTTKSRLKSKLYLSNTFVVLSDYICLFSRRPHYDKGSAVCIIGLESAVLLPVIIFDAVVNVYLTSLFLTPLLGLYSVRSWIKKPGAVHENMPQLSRAPPNIRLRKLALRTFAGVLGTLLISIA